MALSELDMALDELLVSLDEVELVVVELLLAVEFEPQAEAIRARVASPAMVPVRCRAAWVNGWGTVSSWMAGTSAASTSRVSRPRRPGAPQVNWCRT